MTAEIDLAKSIQSVHGVDAHGKAVLRKNLSRIGMRAAHDRDSNSRQFRE
ncbi:MAG: hypothetical protein ABI580_04340 [Burkholderiaceae bacterium]